MDSLTGIYLHSPAGRSDSSQVVDHVSGQGEVCSTGAVAVMPANEVEVLAYMARLANAAKPVQHTLVEALGCICTHMGYVVGHVYLGGCDDFQQILSTALWWGNHADAMAAFRVATEAHPLAPGPGFPAQVLALRVPVQSSNVRREPGYNRRAEARAAGLAGGLAIPVLVSGQVRAVLELYSLDRRVLDAGQLGFLATCGTILGRAVERSLWGEELLAERVARQDAEVWAATMSFVTRELEQKSRELGEELDRFAYIASHDLKAPLRGIACLAGWLREDLGDRLDDGSRQHLELLAGRVRRMESLIDGLLAYSRAGRTGHPPSLVNVRELVDRTIKLLAPNSHVIIDIADNMPVFVTCGVLLQQVFHHLISNALKHGGMQNPRIEVGWAEQDEFYRFWVKDHGPGIHPHYKDKIWGLFQTLQPRDKLEGAGIGLALVKKIVEQQGGAVHLVSRPGHGATFQFSWPKTPR